MNRNKLYPNKKGYYWLLLDDSKIWKPKEDDILFIVYISGNKRFKVNVGGMSIPMKEYFEEHSVVGWQGPIKPLAIYNPVDY